MTGQVVHQCVPMPFFSWQCHLRETLELSLRKGRPGYGAMVLSCSVWLCGRRRPAGLSRLGFLLSRWISMSWPPVCMFLFPKMNVYSRKDPHYSNSTCPGSTRPTVLFLPCRPLLKIYQNGVYQKSVIMQLKKYLNWIIQGNARKLLKTSQV